jgi:glutathione S-transferase
MLTLHYAPDNASLIVRLALEESGLPYRTALVDRRESAQHSAAYLALNPAGLIPALQTPDGAIFETGAILLWLAERAPMALAPAPTNPARGDFLKWLFFTANTAHADLRRMFYPGQYVPEDAIAAHQRIMAARMMQHFTLLDAACAGAPGLFAPPSVLAPYVCTLMRWSVLYPRGQERWFQLARYPALTALATALENRPAAQRAAVAEGLGPRPFTAPVYACPPEGSAT